MKKVILVLVFALVAGLAEAGSVESTPNNQPVRETIGTFK